MGAGDKITVEAVKQQFPEADILDDNEIENEVIKPAMKMNTGRDKMDDIEDALYEWFTDHGWNEEI